MNKHWLYTHNFKSYFLMVCSSWCDFIYSPKIQRTKTTSGLPLLKICLFNLKTNLPMFTIPQKELYIVRSPNKSSYMLNLGLKFLTCIFFCIATFVYSFDLICLLFWRDFFTLFLLMQIKGFFWVQRWHWDREVSCLFWQQSEVKITFYQKIKMSLF